ncbi:type IX secretion system sortase PorU [bacterium]|nr:type IX secretion system sortase PorU [bacterium]
MLKSLLLVLPLSLVLSGQLAAQEVVVLSADTESMVVEYRPAVSMDHPDADGVVFTFNGSVTGDISRAGMPDLRYRKELVALPSMANPDIDILQVDYREEGPLNLLPVADIRLTPEGKEEYIYEEGLGYQIDGLLPANCVQVANLGRSRSHIIADLQLYPVRWNPVTRIARVYTRIRFRLHFGTAESGLQQGSAPIVDVLNPVQAAAWNVPRQHNLLRSTASPTMADGQWYRFEIGETGMYRIYANWFRDAGIDPGSFDPRTLKIYSNGGKERNPDLAASRPDPLQEIPIEVIGEEDGRFDGEDYIQFYGQGLSGLEWNPSERRYAHYIHRFDETNRYLLTFGGAEGRRMEYEDVLDPQTEAATPQNFPEVLFDESEENNLLNSGRLWVGKRLVPNAGSASDLVLTRKLHGLVSTRPVGYRLRLVSSSEVENSFSVRANDQPLSVIGMGTVDFGTETGSLAKIVTRDLEGSGNLADDRSTLTMTYQAANTESVRGGYVDWVEWHYARRFEPLNNELLFSSPDTAGNIAFVLNGYTMSDIIVYDVTDYRNVRRMSGVDISGGTVRFRVAVDNGAPRRFLAVASPAMKTPGAPAQVANNDLLSSSGARYLIITNRELAQPAQRLKTHRERAEDPISSMVVTVEDIYNSFNSGVKDPTAIRDFLAWAVENWSTAPEYVLLFGDGHFDYRNHTTPEPIIVPVWESENSTSRIGTYASDDYYAMVVGTDSRVDLATGRITVLTVEEANTVIDKIIHYETDPDFAVWKNKVTFVGDDGWTSTADTDTNEHTRQSESLADMIPADLEQEKIYLVSYRTEITTQGRRKPDVNAAIIDRINEGTLIMNYTGHGAHDIWAHERVFVSDVTVPQLNNYDRLTFVTAATCTFGLYDAPGIRSGTERLLLHEHGGSIGGLSAPRVVFSSENSAFNTEFFKRLLNEGRESDGRPRRLGDAIYAAKVNLGSSVDGYAKFHLFADPGLRLALPRYRARVDRILINGVPAVSDTVQLRALSNVTLEGSILKPDDSVWMDFDGTAEVSLFDAQRRVVVQDPGWNNFTYTMPGGLLYRGQASVDNGRFAVNFIVPKDISYENNNGRIAMYFENGEVDGAGFSLDLRVGGSDSSATADNAGPNVSVFLDTRSFQRDDETGTDPLLIADLFDESGINTTGLGIGHDIEIWLDGSSKGTVLNSYYRGDIDSYQQGTVEFRMRDLTPGYHTLRMRAWDIFNNSTTVETAFNVTGGLSLQDISNYPNPVSSGTTFSFRHNVLDPVIVDVLIYATSGQLVRHLRTGEITTRVVEIPWDGNSVDGVPLANNLYLYRIVCRTADGALGSEVSGRLVVVR